jgi:hypothetical protein
VIAQGNLTKAVNEFEHVLSQSAGLGADLADHRREAIHLRRLISDTIATIAKAGDEVFTDARRLTDFRNEFSMMRSAMAYHQASWPIVAVDTENESYRASVRGVREANRRFIAWVRRVLAE